jgi:predicted short-subunit dehydrogenase-like oxidoreductase (DUF2520 family)
LENVEVDINLLVTGVIGCGRLGSSLFRALQQRGAGNVFMYSPEPYRAVQSRFLPEEKYFSTLTREWTARNSLIIIAVNDQAIPEVCDKLQQYELSGKIILHTSGAAPASALDSLKQRQAITGSLHPLQTFARRYAPASVWQNITCAFQGDAQAMPVAAKFCEILGARIVPVSAQQKIALHLAASVISNYTVGLIGWAEQILATAGFAAGESNELLQPLLLRTAKNYRNHSPGEILTGPLQRGDAGTMQQHLDFLKQFAPPSQLELYCKLAGQIIANPNFQTEQCEKILELLREYNH